MFVKKLKKKCQSARSILHQNDKCQEFISSHFTYSPIKCKWPIPFDNKTQIKWHRRHLFPLIFKLELFICHRYHFRSSWLRIEYKADSSIEHMNAYVLYAYKYPTYLCVKYEYGIPVVLNNVPKGIISKRIYIWLHTHTRKHISKIKITLMHCDMRFIEKMGKKSEKLPKLKLHTVTKTLLLFFSLWHQIKISQFHFLIALNACKACVCVYVSCSCMGANIIYSLHVKCSECLYSV